MAKASREFVYGLNPAFEVLRAGKRRVFAAHLNEGMRENSRVKKLVSLLERNEVEIEWAPGASGETFSGPHRPYWRSGFFAYSTCCGVVPMFTHFGLGMYFAK